MTFSHYGERGSIDLLAWHDAARVLLVVEIKTELASAEETLRRVDVKVRLAPTIAVGRFGERAVSVARLVVLADTPANRRRVRGAAIFDTALPDRGWRLRSWLAKPAGPMSGLWMPRASRELASRSNPRGARRGVSRGEGRGVGRGRAR